MNSDTTAIIRELIRNGVRLASQHNSSHQQTHAQLTMQLGDISLSANQKNAITQHKTALLEWLNHDHVSCLSPQQQRLWFLADIGQSQHYHVSTMAKVVNGSLDIERLQPALVELAKRHESLRLCIPTLDDTPYLRITPPEALEQSSLTPNLQHLIIDGEPASDLTAEQLIEHPQVMAALNEPFLLETGPLWRCICVEQHHEIKVLILSLHHIVCDAWSMQTAIDQLNQLTQATFDISELPTSPWQYSGYASWQQQKQQADNTAAETFWLQQVLGATPLQLPTSSAMHSAIDSSADSSANYCQNDSLQSSQKTEATARVLQELLTSEEFSQLRESAQQHRTTPFVLYLAGLLLTFAPISQQQDFSVGMPSANRKEQSWQKVFGFFVNTLLLRLRGNPQQSVKSLLADLALQLQHSQSFQDFPIETLLPQWRDSQRNNHNTVQRSSTLTSSMVGQTPLFNALVNYTPPIPKLIELANAQLQPILPSSGYAKFDLTMSFIEFSGESDANHASLVFEFDSARNSETQVQHWAKQLKQNLLALTQNTEQPLSAFGFPQSSTSKASFSAHTRSELANAGRVNANQNAFAPIDSKKDGQTPQPNYSGDTQTLLTQLLDVWQQVFENSTIRVSDDFFSIGGHSLLAVTLAKRITQKLTLAQPLTTLQLLQNPSIEQLARFITQNNIMASQLSSVPLSHSPSLLHTLATGDLTVIFPGLPGSLAGYQTLANQLIQQNSTGSVIGISYPGIENQQMLPASVDGFIEQICTQLNTQLATLRPQKLSVIAHSFGATVALACVSQLSRNIDQLTIIDAAPHQPNNWQQIALLNGAKVNSDTQQHIEVIQFQQFIAMRYSEISISMNTQNTLSGCFALLATCVSEHELNTLQEEWNAVQRLLSFDFESLLNPAKTRVIDSRLGENTTLVIAEDSQDWLTKDAWAEFIEIGNIELVQGDHFSVLGSIDLCL